MAFKRLYPFLFTTIPILNVLARNPGGSTLDDVGALILTMVLGCAVLYAAAALVVRGRARKSLVPLMVLAAVVWFYAYPAIRSAYHLSRGTPAGMALAGGAILILAGAMIALALWLGRRPTLLQHVNTFLALTGLLLTGFLGARVVADQLRARSQLETSSLVSELSQPIRPAPVARLAQEKAARDIYLVVLDEYANSAVLAERFGFDNHVFEDSLRKLGFTIPRLVRSNYVHTLLSIPSLLNYSHLSSLGTELGPQATDPTVPNHLVENNRTAAFLKSQGHRFVFYPSQWWISTRHNRNADSEFRVWSGFDLAREATRSDLRRAFVSSTPLTLLQNDDRHDAEHVERTLAGLEELPADSRPTFAFAHLLNPHYPYVFNLDAGCRPYAARPRASWGQGREKAYLAQVQCLNNLLLGTVTELLQRSSPSPVILLVGDHGTNSLGYSDAKSAQDVSPAQARERFGAFGAFYLPPGGSPVLADSVTLVSILPRVLNHYFDAGIGVPPDSLYMSLERTPYLLVPVDPASLSPRM